MTPEQIRIAIGELDGWRWHGGKRRPKDSDDACWVLGDQQYRHLPIYPYDLNAIRSAVVRLCVTDRQKEEFILHIVGLDTGGHVSHVTLETLHFFKLLTLPPIKWCEALLRTLGKWEESKI